MDNIYSLLDEKLDDADLILVGVGSGLQYDWNLLSQDEKYNEIAKICGDDPKYEAFLQYMQLCAMRDNPDADLSSAFAQLANKLSGKNYFVITTTIDDYVYNAKLDYERIVTPCGGFRNLQCPDGDTNQLIEIDEDWYKKVLFCYQNSCLPGPLEFPKCSVCGKNMVFNQLGVPKYVEEGYLEQWNLYTKWLMGTVNKKVFILELGAGLEFMNIIRSPFERIIKYNQKATFVRVHPTMSQLFMEDEILERAYAVSSDVKDFLIKWK